MDSQIKLQLNYLQAVLRSDRKVEEKLTEVLPLRELLNGDVFGEIYEVKSFVENNWHQLSRILFYVRIYDVDGFHRELLNMLIRYTPPHGHRDGSSAIQEVSA